MQRKTLVFMALAGAVLIGGAAAQAADNTTDWTTSLKVKLELLNELGADGMLVNTDANNGALTLTGRVWKRESRDRAETLAKAVSGVARVQNDILVESGEQNPNPAGVAAGEAEADLHNAMLATRVRIALVKTLGAEGFAIGTEAKGGIVTLRFSKELSGKQGEKASRVAKDIKGVSRVLAVRKA